MYILEAGGGMPFSWSDGLLGVGKGEVRPMENVSVFTASTEA